MTTTLPAAGACPHCGTAVEGGGFCCSGCEMAAAIIHGAGLDRYYETREKPAARPGAHRTDWAAVPVLEGADGHTQAELAVDGLDCAACVWVVERVLQGVPGVQSANVSYATGRARLTWNRNRTNLPELCGRVESLGFRPRPLAAAPQRDRSLLLRLGVAAFVAMNVMLASASLYAGWWSGMGPAYAALFRWTALVLATPVATWGAWPFFRGAWFGLRARVLHMDLPVSLGVVVMYSHAVWATLTDREAYLDSLTMLVALLLAGRVLEQGGRRRATEAALALAASAPRTARRVDGGTLSSVPAATLRPGDLIEVGTGEEIGADGQVVSGRGAVRMALVTGESEPVPVGPRDRVVAGAVLLDGALRVSVERAGPDTLVERLAAGLAHATDRPSPPALTDRIAPWFTAATLLLAGAGGAVWWLTAGAPEAVRVTVAVLVVACPCALALASPLAVAAGLGAAARRGLLLRSGEALRRLAAVDVVVLDKTGTLTTGEPAVVAAEDAVLRVAAGLERQSVHPIARAIVAEAARRGIPLPEGAEVREEAGVGIRGVVDGRVWRLVRGRPGEVALWGDEGHVGAIALRDVVRPDARRAVEALARRAARVVLLTGDHADVAERIAGETGITEVVAAAGPEAKAAWITARRAEGHRVLFVGDGINDGPALAAADVGIAMGTGAAASMLIADGVVAVDGLGPVAAGLDAARASDRAVKGNVQRSLVYNTLAVTLALSGLVNPLVAALLMPASSALVIFGALRVDRAVASA